MNGSLPIPSDAVEKAAVVVPPCLLRRAPLRIDLILKSRHSPEISRRRLHIRAGQILSLQIVPQHSSTTVSVIFDHPLKEIVPLIRIDNGPLPTYQNEFIGHSYLGVVPVPILRRLYISLGDGLPNPRRITIPITIWPSFKMFMVWLIFIFLSVAGARWQGTIANSPTLSEIAPKMRDDIPFLAGLLGLGFLGLVILRMIGFVISHCQSSELPD